MPAGRRVYAIGDIHGRVDLLRLLHDRIAEDARGAPSLRHCIVYLGDYIDRGPYSREVIELLLEGPPTGFEAVCLKGNHEELMLRFLEDAKMGLGWLLNGGDATLQSYGIGVLRALGGDGSRLDVLREHLAAEAPSRHVGFLRRLERWHIEGDYLFVHAGILPGVALDDQKDEDILWIREAFLHDKRDHGKVVVHGHSITEAPEVRQNRIGIDTGAYATGVLTCLVLEGSGHRFLSTADGRKLGAAPPRNGLD